MLVDAGARGSTAATRGGRNAAPEGGGGGRDTHVGAVAALLLRAKANPSAGLAGRRRGRRGVLSSR